MTQWEYITLTIHYEKKPYADWIVARADRAPLVGLDSILEAYGQDGWELVSLEVERYEAFAAFAKWQVEPNGYRATFKRPVES
ncbi:MAG: hypothetical protein E4G99_04660 [Anaerolineales bacterium]|nr:MAG: hypothetical protein E4G99_04660 [Anaerolineales bacterium]